MNICNNSPQSTSAHEFRHLLGFGHNNFNQPGQVPSKMVLCTTHMLLVDPFNGITSQYQVEFMSRIFMLSICCALSISCSPRSPDAAVSFKLDALSLESSLNCSNSRGIWTERVNSEIGVCNEFTIDADNECSDSSQCEGICVIPFLNEEAGSVATGKCSRLESGFGQCLQIVINGVAQKSVCN